MPDLLPPFDADQAHYRFAVECFNTTWELIEKPDRTAADVREMIHRCHASRWHWERYSGHTPKNLAVGDWQLARVYALAGRLEEARRYADQYLNACRTYGLGPGDQAFAQEALARIEGLAGDSVKRDAHLAEAQRAAEMIADEDDRQWVLANIEPLARGQYDWPVK